MKTQAIELKLTMPDGKTNSTVLYNHADDGEQLIASSARETHLDKFGDVAYWLNRSQQAENEVRKARKQRDKARHEAQRLAFDDKADMWAHHYRFCLNQLSKASEALTASCLSDREWLDE